ncbi:MAG TPA: hypothetical protein VJ521_14805, partial [Acidobacteriota bacterium]|nr:hypothetical protein [Acidobacteriota bacterium]
MKIARISTAIHELYPRVFYAKHPQLRRKTYEEQKQALNWDAHRWVDSWSTAMAPYGYRMIDITPTIGPLQQAWAAENNIAFDPARWIWEIPFQQIKNFQPDILFFEDFQYYSQRWIEELRQACTSIRKVFGWCDSPYRDFSLLNAYDIVLCTIPEWGQQLKAQGHLVMPMRHAFDPRFLQRIDLNAPQSIDFSFIGQIARGPHGHLERER